MIKFFRCFTELRSLVACVVGLSLAWGKVNFQLNGKFMD